MNLEILIKNLQDIKDKHGNIQIEACDQSYIGNFISFSIESISLNDYQGKKVLSINYNSGDYFSEGL